MTTEITRHGWERLGFARAFELPGAPATRALRGYAIALRRAREQLADESKPRWLRLELANTLTRAAWRFWSLREMCLAAHRRQGGDR